MIILLDTSTGLCRLTFTEDTWTYSDEWQADRTLAKGLLAYLQEQLMKNHKTWNDITGIGVYRGPGSFTGLRIGITVLNTLADANKIPIVGAVSEEWQQRALEKLHAGQDEKIVLPFYGSDAHITKPRK